MAPDCAGDGKDGGGGQETSHGPAQPLVPHTEAEAAKVHVQDHGEGGGHGPAVVGVAAQARGVVLAHLEIVVEGLEPAQVPAPALVSVAHQTLVTHGVEGRVTRGHADHGVCSPLASWPINLQNTKSLYHTSKYIIESHTCHMWRPEE